MVGCRERKRNILFRGPTFLPTVSEGAFHAELAIFREGGELVVAVEVIRGVEVRGLPGWKFHLPLDGLVHLGEFLEIGLCLDGGNGFRLISRKVARRLKGIHAHVHQRASTGKLFAEAPLLRISDFEAEP